MYPSGVSIIQSGGTCRPGANHRLEETMNRLPDPILAAWMAVFEHEDPALFANDLEKACTHATHPAPGMLSLDLLTAHDAVDCMAGVAGLHGLHEDPRDIVSVNRPLFPHKSSPPSPPPPEVQYACLWVPAHAPICPGNFRVTLEPNPFLLEDKTPLAVYATTDPNPESLKRLEYDLRVANIDAPLARAVFLFRHDV